MTDIEQELYAYLSQEPGIVAVISGGDPVTTRIFPDVAPQSATYPRVTYQRISDVGVDHMGGANDLSHALIQIDAWARSPGDRKDASNAVRNALHGAQGFTLGDVDIRSVRLRNEVDSADYVKDGTDVPVYRTRMDFSIWYKRTAPAFAL